MKILLAWFDPRIGAMTTLARASGIGIDVDDVIAHNHASLACVYLLAVACGFSRQTSVVTEGEIVRNTLATAVQATSKCHRRLICS